MELRSPLAAAFSDVFGGPADYLVHAPGRVNLIGEHIDYAGLSVFPIALTRGLTFAVRARDDARIHVENLEARFGPRTFELAADPEPFGGGDWGNYLKAAAGATYELGARRGYDALVTSDLPIAAGLSSSAALVVGSALALLRANDIEVGTLALAERLAAAERYVGTEGGGMDQAICLGARAGHACRIDFAPLALAPVPIPQDWRFIVASSLVRAEKSGAALTAYNERASQSGTALAEITHALETGPSASYGDLLESWSAGDLVAAAARHLDDPLRRRFRHVVTEAGRVDAAQAAMRRGDREAFGRAMTASHASLRDDYEVSGPELNELCAIAERAGAAGARLTGAGFGGCIVALCGVHEADDVLTALRREYYADRTLEGPIEDHLFVAEPGRGAVVGEG